MQRRSRLHAMLVEPDANVAASIEHHLKRSPLGAAVQVSWTPTLAAAIDKTRDRHVDVALLDLSVTGGGGWESFARLREAAPALPVVVLGAEADDGLAIRVVRAGAEDYFVKGSATPDELARALRHTVERHARQVVSNGVSRVPRRRRGRVVGFIGAKGGVGTTTVAANFAAAVARAKQRVIAAELRSFCGTMRDHFARTPASGHLGNLLNMPAESISEQELSSHLWHCSTELALLPAPERPGDTGDLDDRRARAIVDGLATLAPLVVLDLPPQPSAANKAAAAACHFLGLVVDREPGCLHAAEVMAQHLGRWQVKGQIGLIVVHRTPLACPVELAEFTSRTRLDIVEVIPPAPDACAMAVKAGIPVVETYDDSLVGSSIRKLAEAVGSSATAIRARV